MYSRLVLVILVASVVSVLGHSYITTATTNGVASVSRSIQKETNTGCRGPACLGPCDAKVNQSRSVAALAVRGQSLNIKWPRNNHAGGFIRFAWTQTSASDNHASFDNNVYQIWCHEVGGCGPDNAADPNGGDSGTSDGSVRPCQADLVIPLYLTNGPWTLQWAWFGGAFALGDYYSCVDFIVNGGPSGSQLAPAFIGGDYTYPGQNKCKFFNTDELHVCINEPCSTGKYPGGERSGPPVIAPSATSSSATTTSTSSTTTTSGPVTTRVLTTRAVTSNVLTTKAVTSGAVTSNVLTTNAVTSGAQPLTTQARPITSQVLTTNPVPSATTARPPITSAALTTSPQSSSPLTTKSQTSNPLTTNALTTRALTTSRTQGGSTTRVSALTTSTAGTQNCASLTTVVPPTVLAVSIINVDTYSSNGFRVYFRMDVYDSISNWAVQIIWPAGLAPQVTEVADGADFGCESNYPNSHAVVVAAPYNNDLEPPNDVYFEVETNIKGVDPDYLRNNIQTRVYRR